MKLSQNNQPTGAMGDMMAMAEMSKTMGLNDPPPIKDLLSLLGTAQGMQQNERDTMIKQQALELQRQKQAEMSPEMLQLLLMQQLVAGNPAASAGLINKAAGYDVVPQQPAAPEPTALPTLGAPAALPQAGSPVKPSGRREVQSQKPFLGYQPPSGDVEAVLDQNGNIINFVQKGTKTPVNDYVPSPESIGAWGSSKYALSQQMKALGQYLGLAPKPQPTTPY